jgi:hypothetical protein
MEPSMTRERAIEIALNHLRADGTRIKLSPPAALHKESDMRGGDNLRGWVVIVPLDVPFGIEPDEIHVEVYEPDGGVFIPRLL